ncbi:thymidylate synthase [Paracidovorax wautersii]|uniref:thymidylate synthase n=1 Tax=Paracidovorax wautersii TaxID=1177982 RepID=UPI003369EC1C
MRDGGRSTKQHSNRATQKLAVCTTLFDYQLADFEVRGYEHHPAIKAPVAV